jgi:uroporphyrin-III C-methyltransferase
MGKAAASEVANGLMGAGLAGDTPVALVENASLPASRRLLTRLDLLPLAARTALTDGPTIILVGQALGSKATGSSRSLKAVVNDRFSASRSST